MSLSSSSLSTTPPPPVPWAWIRAARDIVQAEPRTQPEFMPVELVPWLYLSNLPSVMKFDRLTAMGITAVLTTNKIVRDDDLWRLTAQLSEHDIQHGYVGGVDIVGYDMMKYHWDDAKAFFQQALAHDKPKIVVHCAAGTNRSALLAGAALLTFPNGNNDGGDDGDDDKGNLNFINVIRLLKQQRGVVLNNVWFIRQLAEFAQRQGRLGPKPAGYADEALRNSEMIF